MILYYELSVEICCKLHEMFRLQQLDQRYWVFQGFKVVLDNYLNLFLRMFSYVPSVNNLHLPFLATPELSLLTLQFMSYSAMHKQCGCMAVGNRIQHYHCQYSVHGVGAKLGYRVCTL